MAFTTFVYDTLDVCTRLGRYIIQELTGWHNRTGRWFATALTAGAPLFFLFQNTVDAAGRPQPVWRTYWNLFGASNQLLAALTLLGVTVWLWRTRGAAWVWYVTGLPMAWMYTMSMWALFRMIRGDIKGDGLSLEPSSWLAAMSSLTSVGWVAIILVALAALMLVEAIRVFLGTVPRPPAEGQPIPISAT
jgi:carbon starvation protein